MYRKKQASDGFLVAVPPGVDFTGEQVTSYRFISSWLSYLFEEDLLQFT